MELGWLWLTLAESSLLIGDTPLSQQQLAQAESLFLRANSLQGMSDVRWAQCLIASNIGDENQRRELMNQSLRLATDASDHDRADGAWLALRCFDAFEAPDKAYSEYASEILPFGESPDLSNAAIARCFLARSALSSGNHAECVEHIAKGIEAAELSGYVTRSMSDSAYLGSILYEMGDLDGSLEHMTSVLDRARKLGWPSTIAASAGVLSNILSDLGRTDAARNMAAEAFQTYPTDLPSIGSQLAGYCLAECERASKNLISAKQLFDTLRTSSIAEAHEIRLYSTIRLSQIELTLGNLGLAIHTALEGLTLARASGDLSAESLALEVLGGIASAQRTSLTVDGLELDAVELVTRAVSISEAITGGNAPPSLLQCLADTLAHSGHSDRAIEQYKRVLAALERTKLLEAQKRVLAIEVRLKTEGALREAHTQRLLAQAESRRASELQHMNSQLNATLLELEAAQARLLQRNAQLSEAYAQIRELSYTDPLTGLKNRRYFTEAISNTIAECRRKHSRSVFGNLESDSSTAHHDSSDVLFFLLDLDRFKSVNDTYGHASGDAVLVELKNRLSLVTRDCDYLVRWGGEEVLVSTPHSNRADAPAVAERLRRSVSDRPFEIGGGQTIKMTVSVGYAVYPPVPQDTHCTSWESVVETADQRLYVAKRSGRNRCVGWDNAPSSDSTQSADAAMAPVST